MVIFQKMQIKRWLKTDNSKCHNNFLIIFSGRSNMKVSHVKNLQSGKKPMILRSRLLGWLNTWLSMVLTVQSANSAIHWQREAACISHVANASMSSVVAVAKHLLWEPNALWDHIVPSWACMLTTHVTASFTWGIRSLHNCRNYFRYKITKLCTTRINRYLQNVSNEQNDQLFNILHQCLGNIKSMDIICGFKSQTATMLLVSSIPTCTGVTTVRISVCYLLVIQILYTYGL